MSVSTSTSDRLKRISRQSFGVRNRSPWRRMISEAVHQFHENDLFTSAAAMSYFGLMTLFPALLLLLALSNRIAAGTEMIAHIVQVYPGSGKFLRETIKSLSGVSTGVIITCAVIVLWAGSWVFSVVERALNRVWGTTHRTFLHGRALTVAMIGIVGLLLSLSVLVTSVLVYMQEVAGRLSPRQLENYAVLSTVGSLFWQIVFAVVSLLVTFALFSIVYKFMPNAYVSVRDTIPGAVIGGLLWEAAKYGFAWTLNYFNYEQVYGSVGAVVAVLTWGYVSSLVLLFGAQLTGVFHREHIEHPIVAANAQVASASYS
ncbi:MAG TPA: YihY/virulence factor BrkB family protein [Pyrinomonadaceae bacterium]|jgi:YihY family inner membrane protein|nr:YihY/virulence factor BrkB family protein [Pyrinomonadaceae bacterium]